MAEPIVTGFGLTTEAAINDPAATQCAASLTGGGVQQSTRINVIFFVSIKGFVELVTYIPLITNFKTRPPPVIVIKIFANEEFRKGDRPIATPIPIEIKVFVSIKQRY